MKKLSRPITKLKLAATLLTVAAAMAVSGQTVDLFQRYPTKLTAGDSEPSRARPWQFTQADVFRVSSFDLKVGNQLQIELPSADLGIGHCADGAVWAVLISSEGGKLIWPGAKEPEVVANVWLRFHPKEINRLFPNAAVSAQPAASLVTQMRAVANAKFRSSWHAGQNALMPEIKDLTVDIDTKTAKRRFFIVDTSAGTAQYLKAFEKQSSTPASANTSAPRVSGLSPRNGAQDVSPTVTELRVTFNVPMSGGMSWCGGGEGYPATPEGKSAYWTDDHLTCVLPVVLKAGRTYEIGLNGPSFRNFRSAAGVPLAPVTYTFRTKE
jgi:Bacterial Ig-like domain